jgi:hypothetical protein
MVFLVLGFVFLRLGTAERMSPMALIQTLVVAVVVAGLGLAGWFLLV